MGKLGASITDARCAIVKAKSYYPIGSIYGTNVKIQSSCYKTSTDKLEVSTIIYIVDILVRAVKFTQNRLQVSWEW